LKLAVLQGTSDAILAVAPGHEPQSVMPGTPGTAVIVAHNLTFFRNIDLLRHGDPLTVQTAAGTFTFRVTGHRIVPADTSLPNTPRASLALIACYPLNALYLTPQRYVVFASLTRSTEAAAASLPDAAAPPPTFQATLPPALQKIPLWLSDTNLTVSSANFTGGSSTRLTASGGSWSLVAQAIRMFAGTLRALADGGSAPLAGFGPDPKLMGLTPPGPWVIRPAAGVAITTALRPDGSPSTVTVALPYATLLAGRLERSGSYATTLKVAQNRLYLLAAQWTP
jgi:sortase A